MLSNLLLQHLVLQHVASSKLPKTIFWELEKFESSSEEGFKIFVHFYSSIKPERWYGHDKSIAYGVWWGNGWNDDLL